MPGAEDTARGTARRELADRYGIRLAGAGGQGMILVGVILAEAAVIDGLNVVQTQSYGPEARGGASRSEVILSKSRIDYPKVVSADLLLCMSQEAADRFGGDVNDDGLVVIDENNVSKPPAGRVVGCPITDLAFESTGRRITASVLGIGVVAGLVQVVGRAALEQALSARVPLGTEELNLRALAAGYDAAEDLREAVAQLSRA